MDHWNWTASGTEYLVYDGHGSTRQLVDNNEDVKDAFSYDGYGVKLKGSDPFIWLNIVPAKGQQ